MPLDDMTPFLHRQFDKLLLISLIVLFAILLMHLHADKASAEIRELVQFFREVMAGIVGAFLGLIQAQYRDHRTPKS